MESDASSSNLKGLKNQLKLKNEEDLDRIKNFLRPTSEPWRQTVRSTI